jgi:hypothetical protein
MVLDPAALPAVFGRVPAPGICGTATAHEGPEYQERPQARLIQLCGFRNNKPGSGHLWDIA